jgi:3-hydroxymyristoyl/3-hydroxydecanoyl-(acyl carrier protein) dehydratase
MCPDRDRDELLPGVELLRLEFDAALCPEEDRRSFAAEVQVARDSPLLDGHFPGQPVLPGVALVGTVVELCRRAFGDVGLKGMERVKLLEPVLPGARLSVRVTESEVQRRFEVARVGDGGLVATGTLRS